VCNGQADIVFVLDESGSVGIANFQRSKQFASDAVAKFVIGENAIRFIPNFFTAVLFLLL
jgi:hypothetical protein